MISIKHEKSVIPLTWFMVKRDNIEIPKIVCKCGETGVINNHEIASDGTITPSFFHDTTECGFHDMIKLEDYK